LWLRSISPRRNAETQRIRLSQQSPPTPDLRTFGNSYPQSFFGIHTMSFFGRGGVRYSALIVWGGTMLPHVCLVAALLSALLSGCASAGNESIADATPESVSAQLVKGKSTQEQVRGLYGDPTKTSFTDSGNEIWEYDFSRMHAKPTNFIPYVNLVANGAEGDKKSLVIFFDKSKVVRQYTVSSSKVDVSQGLITR